jgi:hypothetical protein
VRRAYIAVAFHDLHLFHIRAPHMVGAPGNLAAGNTDAMPGLYAFIANLTFSHDSSSSHQAIFME